MMYRIQTLKKRSDFLALRAGKRFQAKSFILKSLKQKIPGAPRIGYTVTTKTGNAVVRNRIKRRLREAVSKSFPAHALNGYDYNLIGKSQAVELKFDRIVNELNVALDHIHKIRSKPNRKTGKSDSPRSTNPKQT